MIKKLKAPRCFYHRKRRKKCPDPVRDFLWITANSVILLLTSNLVIPYLFSYKGAVKPCILVFWGVVIMIASLGVGICQVCLVVRVVIRFFTLNRMQKKIKLTCDSKIREKKNGFNYYTRKIFRKEKGKEKAD